ncbi:MAG: hypothetical protein LUH23_09910 [Oscillospiraceae bacterium]|nr:hypothetical protein [Oscillospiraceae bacterium]
MKKFLSIALAVVMVLSVSVCAFADDALVSETTMFWSNGNWNDYTLDEITMPELIEALQTEGACLCVTRDTETHISFADGGYEKFNILDSWWSGTVESTGYQWVVLGTAGHTDADEPDSGIIDCVYDDGVTVMWDGATVAQALIDGGFNSEGGVTMIINSSDDGAYKVSSVSVVISEYATSTSSAEEETTEETSEETTEEAEDASDATEETTETTESSSSSSSSSSPDTGVALALVPMAIAGIAVVSSKRR